MEQFAPRPDKENEGAMDEWKKGIGIHDADDLHDEEGSRGINEATGVQEKTKAVDGADEVLKESSVVELRLPQLPEDPNAMNEWIKKEEERLKKRKKAA